MAQFNIILTLLRVFITNSKKWLTVFHGQLGEDHNRTENVSMIINAVAVGLIKNSPLLEAFVNCFMAAADALLHPLILNRIYETGWAFHLLRCFAPVSVIRFDTLISAKVVLQSMAKNVNIRPFSGSKWPMNPGYEASQDVQANFVSQSRLHCIFVR